VKNEVTDEPNNDVTDEPIGGVRDGHLLTVIRSLAEAPSTQSKVSNRLWISLAVLSLLVLFPPTSVSTSNVRELPFGLGEVDSASFDIIICPMFSILVIAFCQAHAQTVRASLLAHRAIDQLGNSIELLGIHPRDLFDAFRHPALTRVAPLPQLSQGPHQFEPEFSECPQWRKDVTGVYYVVLKFVATGVYFFLPAYSLIVAFLGLTPDSSSSCLMCGAYVLIYLVGAVAGLTLLHLFVAEYLYVREVRNHLVNGEQTGNRPS